VTGKGEGRRRGEGEGRGEKKKREESGKCRECSEEKEWRGESGGRKSGDVGGVGATRLARPFYICWRAALPWEALALVVARENGLHTFVFPAEMPVRLTTFSCLPDITRLSPGLSVCSKAWSL